MDKQITDTTRCAWKNLEGTLCPEAQEQLDRLKVENKSKTEYIQEQRDIINQYSKEIEMYKKCQGKRASKREEELKAENEELKEKLENYCFDCDVAERMAKVIYAATGGRLSYSNYTVEAIEQAYNDQLCIDVEYRTKELEEELEQLNSRCKSLEEISDRLQKQNHELTLENEKLEVYRSITPLSVKKLEQTLTEIKEIAESCGWDFGSEILYERIDQILDKISEVIEDENI